MVFEVFENGTETDQLAPVLEEIGTTGTLEVTTKFYEWLSGSGNHTAYFSEVSFRAA